jgi:hypothetical protein
MTAKNRIVSAEKVKTGLEKTKKVLSTFAYLFFFSKSKRCFFILIPQA